MTVSGQNIFWFFDTGVNRWKFHTLSLSLIFASWEIELPESLWKMYSGSFCYCPICHWTFTTYFLISALTTEIWTRFVINPNSPTFWTIVWDFNPNHLLLRNPHLRKSVVTAILLQQNFFIIIRHRCIDQQRKTEKFSITPKLIYVPISFGRMFRLQWRLRTTYLGLRGSTGPSSRSACSIVWTFSVGRFDRHIDFLSQTFEHFYWCNEVHRQRTSTVSCSLCQNPRLK